MDFAASATMDELLAVDLLNMSVSAQFNDLAITYVNPRVLGIVSEQVDVKNAAFHRDNR